LGFWKYPVKGRSTHSDRLMDALLKAQAEGKDTGDMTRLDLDAAEIKKKYSAEQLPGHAAWLDWPWKLHRIENKGEAGFELYNLVDDPGEQNDVAARHPERVDQMKARLERWQQAVIRSHNGVDYQ
jgi:arylsulfatase A-like enzyme